MKSTALLLGAAAAAMAAPQAPGDSPVNCAKPNVNYCVAADIILRCDENAMGYPARCSPNLSGYPPAGGVASCWESGHETGDAACAKNCVVYPAPPDAAFTLAADECTPSYTETESHHVPTHTSNTTITTIITTTYCEHGCTESHPPPPPPPTNGTWVPTVTHIPPPGTTGDTPPPPPPPPPHTNGTWVPTVTHLPPPGTTGDTPPPPPPPPPPTNGTWIPTVTRPPPPGSTDDTPLPPPPPPPGTTEDSDGPTNVPIPPTNIPAPPTTTGPPTGAAVTNKAGLLLGAAGFVVAYLL